MNGRAAATTALSATTDTATVPAATTATAVPKLSATASATTAIPLYLLPPAGGASALFAREDWDLSELGVRAEPVELPGHGTRFAQPAITAADELIAWLDETCKPPVRGPWAVLGHSVGALFAAAWAAHAHAAGCGPIAVYLSAAAPPWEHHTAAELASCDDDELWRRMSAFDGLPRDLSVTPVAARLFTRVLRADVTAAAQLCGRPPASVGCPVLVLCGRQDTALPSASLDSWAAIADGGFARVDLPGGHFYRGGLRDLAPPVHADLALRFVHPVASASDLRFQESR